LGGKIWSEGFKKQTIITNWQRKVFETVTAKREVQSICGVLHSLYRYSVVALRINSMLRYGLFNLPEKGEGRHAATKF